jgi:hypothetical protein
VPVNIPKSFLKCCLSNAGDGTRDYILWDNSEQSGEGATSSEDESATEGSLDELSDEIKSKCARSENFKFPFHSGIFSITFHLKCVLNIPLF